MDAKAPKSVAETLCVATNLDNFLLTSNDLTPLKIVLFVL